ncbi:MAG TPA: TonB-dependent receptor plug domain-containing protein, partial [Salinimicrobium sp.]|nr:TonB-dependent receptor plug domain-containing protein [Salinimicrobium sp.]
MRSFTFFLFFFTFIFSSAQEITVLDKSTKQPLFNVAVFNSEKTKSTFTDFNGKADITLFAGDEIIFFRHINHEEFQASKNDILTGKNIVLLEKNQNQLQEVVLSVSKFQQRKKDIPQKIVSLSREDIIFSNPQTSADLLERAGQVYVQKSQLGGGSPMIRGFATNRLLITVDGVRMNTAIFRGGNVQNVISIDPLAVQRTEVVLGPGSVVYGSDAIGGVMNFYTLKPQFSYDKTTKISGNAFARYATANNEKTGHLHLTLGTQKWAFLTSFSASDFGDLKMGRHGPEEYLRHEYSVRKNAEDVILKNDDPGIQKPTGYEQINLLE